MTTTTDPYRATVRSRIPPLLIAGLDRYIEHRIPTGGFLRAVLSNDLQGAIGRADPDSLAAIKDIVEYVYLYVPAEAWGSPEKVDRWTRGES